MPGSAAWAALAAAVGEVADALVAQLIRDAEGGTRVLIAEVDGAADDGAARALARAVVDSPLVKTAAFGGDPNPGRILQAVGAADVDLDPAGVDVWIGDAHLVERGTIPPSYFADGALEADARRAMSSDGVHDPRARRRRPRTVADVRLRSVLRVRADQRGVHDVSVPALPPQIRERTVAKARTLLEALPFMRAHQGKAIVVKYGGAAMDSAGLAASFAQDVGAARNRSGSGR